MADDEFSMDLPQRAGCSGSINSGRFAKAMRGGVNAIGRATPDMSRRDRAQWFNRSKGRGTVKAKAAAPAKSQRVIVKARVVKMGATGKAALARHISYVERDGVGREGEEGRFFDAGSDQADGRAFAKTCAEDRHHFRFIVSPENGADIADMKGFARGLMGRAEEALGTKLDWIGAEHHDSGHPHLHLIIRGVRSDGRDLVMSREFISHGMRREAQGLATELLGERQEKDLRRDLSRLAQADRFTALDKELTALSSERGLSLDILSHSARFPRDALVQRLVRLEEMGLAERAGAGNWQLADGFGEALQKEGEINARVDALRRICARDERDVPDDNLAWFYPGKAKSISGQLIGMEATGLDENGRTLIAIDGVDGNMWLAEASSREMLRSLDGVKPGAIIEISAHTTRAKPSDRLIAEIAATNDGLYSAEIHRAAVPTDRAAFITTHVRRLEALASAGRVQREGAGVFRIGTDYEAVATAHETLKTGAQIEAKVLDPRGLTKQIDHKGLTWLDQTMNDGSWAAVKNEGFGAAVRVATAGRIEWLKSKGLARDVPGKGVCADSELHTKLRAMEREHVLDSLWNKHGRTARFAVARDEIAGVYIDKVHSTEGTFAVFQDGRGLSLSPWRPELDVARGHFVFGKNTAQGLDFSFGPQAAVQASIELEIGRYLG
jgi:type IV secretory pathway VirD2 relaxase